MNDLNEPAFPTESAEQAGRHTWRYEGMSLRDYFAAKAMQVLIAKPEEPFKPQIENDCIINLTDNLPISRYRKLCKTAYEYADIMLEARKENQ